MYRMLDYSTRIATVAGVLPLAKWDVPIGAMRRVNTMTLLSHNNIVNINSLVDQNRQHDQGVSNKHCTTVFTSWLGDQVNCDLKTGYV